MAQKPRPIPPGMERPPGLPTSPPPPRVETQTGIWVRIYRDGAKHIDIRGFATVQQAVDAGNQWEERLWWRVTQDGKIVTEEPMRTKK